MSESETVPLDVARRQRQVAELSLQGWTQAEIAERLQVSQATVSRDLVVIHDEWRAAAGRDLEFVRAQELEKLVLLEREAWDAWLRSLQASPTSKATRRARARGRQGFGDVRFLDLVIQCICQRRTMLGLDPPVQVAEVSLLNDTLENRRMRLNAIFQSLKDRTEPSALPDIETDIE